MTDTDTTAEKIGGGRFAGATLVTIASVATITPMIAASLLNVPFRWDGRWSTGGLVAFGASIAMWIWCRSWRTWRRWIWLPIAVTVILAIVVVGSARAEMHRVAEQERQQLKAACAAAQDKIASLQQQRADLIDETVTVVGNPYFKGEPPAPGATDWSRFGSTVPALKDAWVYYVRRGGPDLERETSNLKDDYARSCSGAP